MDEPEPTNAQRFHAWNVLTIIELVAAMGLGWQVSIVRHHRAMRKQIDANAATAFTNDVWQSYSLTEQFRPGTTEIGFSVVRRLLGDKRLDSITLRRKLTPADREAINAFPDAEVWAIPDSAEATDNP